MKRSISLLTPPSLRVRNISTAAPSTPIKSLEYRGSISRLTPPQWINKISTAAPSTPIKSLEYRGSISRLTPPQWINKISTAAPSTPIKSLEYRGSISRLTPPQWINKISTAAPSTPIKSLEYRGSISRLTPPQWINKISTAAPSTPIKSLEYRGSISRLTPPQWINKISTTPYRVTPPRLTPPLSPESRKELDDLRQFTTLEALFSKSDEPDGDSARWRRDLKLCKEHAQQAQQDRPELLMYRTGLMSTNTCDHDGLEERNEELMAQQAAMDARNKELEQNAEHFKVKLQEAKQAVELAKSNAKRRQDELLDLLSDRNRQIQILEAKISDTANS